MPPSASCSIDRRQESNTPAKGRRPGRSDNPHLVKVVVDREGFDHAGGHSVRQTREPAPDVLETHRPLRLPAGLPSQARVDDADGARAAPRVSNSSRVLENGFRIATVETDVDTIGVDTPADLAKVRELIEARTISPGVTSKPEEVSWDRQTDSDSSNTSS